MLNEYKTIPPRSRRVTRTILEIILKHRNINNVFPRRMNFKNAGPENVSETVARSSRKTFQPRVVKGPEWKERRFYARLSHLLIPRALYPHMLRNRIERTISLNLLFMPRIRLDVKQMLWKVFIRAFYLTCHKELKSQRGPVYSSNSRGLKNNAVVCSLYGAIRR